MSREKMKQVIPACPKCLHFKGIRMTNGWQQSNKQSPRMTILKKNASNISLDLCKRQNISRAEIYRTRDKLVSQILHFEVSQKEQDCHNSTSGFRERPF